MTKIWDNGKEFDSKSYAKKLDKEWHEKYPYGEFALQKWKRFDKTMSYGMYLYFNRSHRKMIAVRMARQSVNEEYKLVIEDKQDNQFGTFYHHKTLQGVINKANIIGVPAIIIEKFVEQVKNCDRCLC